MIKYTILKAVFVVKYYVQIRYIRKSINIKSMTIKYHNNVITNIQDFIEDIFSRRL